MLHHHIPSPINRPYHTVLEDWRESQWIRHIDIELVYFLEKNTETTLPWQLGIIFALTSYQLGRGHVCLDLNALFEAPYHVLSLPPDQVPLPDTQHHFLPEQLLALSSLDECIGLLKQYTLLVTIIQTAPNALSKNHDRPFALKNHRLYLQRYWHYENCVEKMIRQRVRPDDEVPKGDSVNNLPQQELMRQALNLLFPNTSTEAQTDWQKIATALATTKRFNIITGGPGTGKTTTVVRLLALLNYLSIHQQSNTPLRIKLAAPTGKAAARLKESIASAIYQLPAELPYLTAIQANIPTEVHTLHKLLGPKPHSRFFKHHRHHPLPLDILVVDEASMIDLEMMYTTLDALPNNAKIILLGDKDQLASVEAGSVLGELCQRAQQGHYTPLTQQWIKNNCDENIDDKLIDQQGTDLDQSIIMLRQSRRFTQDSGIGLLAQAVNASDAQQVRHIIKQNLSDLSISLVNELSDPAFEQLILSPQTNDRSHRPSLHTYLSQIRQRPNLNDPLDKFDEWARQVLFQYSRFQLLSALREGPYGVQGLNQRIEQLLYKRSYISHSQTWYQGRPVIVTRNDYSLALMNGDIGITLAYPRKNLRTAEVEWQLRVAFLKSDGSNEIQWVQPNRLPHVDTVYALTVHKSQGSEFEHCVLLLPPYSNPILTKELIYTGITRAKSHLSLICTQSKLEPKRYNYDILLNATQTSIQRSGGLFRD